MQRCLGIALALGILTAGCGGGGASSPQLPPGGIVGGPPTPSPKPSGHPTATPKPTPTPKPTLTPVPTPSPTPTPHVMQHAYVMSAIAAAHSSILIYDLPLSAGSKPVGAIPDNFQLDQTVESGCADNQSRLFVTTSEIFGPYMTYAFTQPIRPSSTPAFFLSPTGVICTFDPAGNLYEPIQTSASTEPLEVFPSPVGPTSAPIIVAAVAPYGVAGLTTDAIGDVFAYNVESKTFADIVELSPRGSGNQKLAEFGNGPNFREQGLAIGPDGNLYAGDATGHGIDVYFPSSFHNGGVKDHTISLGSVFLAGLAFDSSANMIAVVGSPGPGALYVLPPPYNAPSFIVPVNASIYGFPTGIAITQ